ncbi:hypothetical protein ASPZODRAFT_153269 [Penicilliopsis zonata CBS 506.65]|uniref:Queuosine 5'-phosphate N-glycosylase/hydrolase n=1 Tax=Penicilliopsis zonata CBS 506.65 TaxID=1073090 RepID=A0A1L9SCM6_9EURO|nr:hypothetical protein ASPZODRAFT_153269 [Penicilliopsis zonata CBS 506.65]OJJ44936.1 hypothetical protein ASPZODRAFT_153269 [Penicilliopsis zonata CBS 506.65]
MSDDEADPELIALLRKSLGLDSEPATGRPAETKVLENAQYIFDNSIDVALDPSKTKQAAETIWRLMQEKEYSTQTWSDHELHPQSKDESTVNFIFTMDLLNFSFWSDEPDESKRFVIEYHGKTYSGYWSLVAALQRALEEDIPITTPSFWLDEEQCSESVLKHVFRSATEEEMPLLRERMQCLREAGQVLCDVYDGSFVNCIYEANNSAGVLVNLLAEEFACFRDESIFHGRKVRFYKRAQILVADLWACFNGQSFGEFHDIDKVTMFADYRIPQMLHQLGCLMYSPPLDSHIRSLKTIPSGSTWEAEMRGTSIWCVELIRREIERRHPEVKARRISTSIPNRAETNITNGLDESIQQKGDQSQQHSRQNSRDSATKQAPLFGVNAILIDFFLYDTMKKLELEKQESVPHHRTRSIWY